ncbi:hypothetical protein [Streptomyces sp. SID12488]|uniref:hypothetical protein n=1 Tax=Streptomyces sp. SID12488 TaxID=2706040 RepID=UPI001EF2C854|nr:hypothetical protein [Streptomyces sp. SID12488]
MTARVPAASPGGEPPPQLVPAVDEERARLEAVRRYDILDTPPDGAFDRVGRSPRGCSTSLWQP